ncbi:MAG: hypothetical protein AAF384_02875 [Pseudomonadota bacterium]
MDEADKNLNQNFASLGLPEFDIETFMSTHIEGLNVGDAACELMFEPYALIPNLEMSTRFLLPRIRNALRDRSEDTIRNALEEVPRRFAKIAWDTLPDDIRNDPNYFKTTHLPSFHYRIEDCLEAASEALHQALQKKDMRISGLTPPEHWAVIALASFAVGRLVAQSLSAFYIDYVQANDVQEIEKLVERLWVLATGAAKHIGLLALNESEKLAISHDQQTRRASSGGNARMDPINTLLRELINFYHEEQFQNRSECARQFVRITTIDRIREAGIRTKKPAEYFRRVLSEVLSGRRKIPEHS